MASSCVNHQDLATPLVIEGPVNLQTVDALRDRLLETIQAGPRLELRLPTDAPVDLTGIQLLEAARRSATAAGGELRLAVAAEGEWLATLQRGGFLQTPEQCRFWLKDEG